MQVPAQQHAHTHMHTAPIIPIKRHPLAGCTRAPAQVAAAKAHDIAAIKSRGSGAAINFSLRHYEPLLPSLNDAGLSLVRCDKKPPSWTGRHGVLA